MSPAPSPEQLAHAARWAHRLILGREPESEAAVAQWAALGDPLAIRRGMLRTDEAVVRLDRGWPDLGDWAARPVEEADLAAVHLLRCGRLPAPAELAAEARPESAGALRRRFLDSAEFRAEMDALDLGEGEAEVLLAGRRFRVAGRRHDAYWAAAARGSADPALAHLARVIRAALPDGGEGAVLVDAGANIGLSALVMAAAAPRHARLLAIEPDPRNLPLLARNLAANGLDRATVLDWALGAARGRAPFRLEARNAAVGHLLPESAEGPPVRGPRVRVGRLDALLRREGLKRLDVLKLDIEGGEEAALEGAGRLLQTARPLVYAEFNLWTILALADRNPRHLLEAWAARAPHLVAFTRAGDPWPLASPADRLALLHSLIVERQGITDLVLCHDLAWIGRWA